MLARHDPEELLDAALSVLATGSECRARLDEMHVPIYTTDTDGRVTYWNRACVDFAGRQPKLGEDRWCVTWQLFTTTGELLRHEDGPMAEAIRQRKPVRDLIVIAERPDRSRVAFRAYPTPLFDAQGRMTAAVNMLVDVTAEQCAALYEQAERCRRLAEATYDRGTCAILEEMAKRFDETARKLSNDQ